MVMSIERVFVRQCIRSLGLNEGSVFRGSSSGAYTLSDILTLLGYVQRAEPVGSMVLNAQIADDPKDRHQLAVLMADYLYAQHVMPRELAGALAEAAVCEVCDTKSCSKCRGTGLSNGKSNQQCTKCEGIGRDLKSERWLVRHINRQMSTMQMSRDAFRKKWYRPYADAVDRLNVEANKAAHAIKRKLRDE